MTWYQHHKQQTAGPLQAVIDDIDAHLRKREAERTPEEKAAHDKEIMEYAQKVIDQDALIHGALR